MTIEKALGIINNTLFIGEPREDIETAIETVTSALSENKGDLISRLKVESVLHNNLHALIDSDQLDQLYKDINCLHAYSIPDSAEENNTEWIDNGVDDFECHCKKCGQEIFKVQKWFKFCPNCGRRVANI